MISYLLLIMEQTSHRLLLALTNTAAPLSMHIGSMPSKNKDDCYNHSRWVSNNLFPLYAEVPPPHTQHAIFAVTPLFA